MRAHGQRLRSLALAGAAFTLLSLGIVYAFPSLSPHPHDAASIAWEQDGTKDGSGAHNHRSNRSFRGFGDHGEPYSAYSCWDDATYRVDLTGGFDNGHCYVDENAGAMHVADYAFVGAGWPADAQARVRDAFAAWSAITSDRAQLLTGIAFEETTDPAQAELTVRWINLADSANGGRWRPGPRELHLDSSFNWYFAVDPAGIANGQWHFYSVALHEAGHAVGFFHQLDLGDLMTPPVGQPPEVAGHRYFMAPDVDSIAGIRDLYSQPHRRIAFVIDDTGSMSQEIGLVKTTVEQKVDEFVAENLLLQYHLLTYKDDVTYRGKTTDPDLIKSWVNALGASGGGDCPEEMLGALDRIADEAPHSDAWVMTDAGFHGGPGDVAATLFKLVANRVRVHPIVYSLCFSDGAAVAGQEEPGGKGAGKADSPAGLGEASFVQIASETGGHYFRIATGETQAAASILLSEMVSTVDLSNLTAAVTGGGTRSFELQVDGASERLNVLLNGLSGGVALALRDPTGLVVEPGDPGVTHTAIANAEYYQLEAPLAGLWQAEVSGDGTFTLSASGDSPIAFSYLADTSLPIGEPAALRVSLSGPVSDPAFSLVQLDGSPFAALALFDDGMHGDGSAGDGVFGGTWVPSAAGTVRIRAAGTAGDGSAFERVAPEAIRIQPLLLTADVEQQDVGRGDSLVYEITLVNLGTTADTFELTVTDTEGWVDPAAVPPAITVGAGSRATIGIPVQVPLDAPERVVDQITVVATSQSDPFVNDAIAVFLTMTTHLPEL